MIGMNTENLRPIRLTHEQAVEIGRRGGLARVEKDRQRKLLRETISVALAAEVADEDVARQLEEAGLDNSQQSAIVYAMIRRAAAGDVEAARFLRDTAGQKPTDQFNLSLQQTPIQAMDLSALSDAELLELASHCAGDADADSDR